MLHELLTCPSFLHLISAGCPTNVFQKHFQPLILQRELQIVPDQLDEPLLQNGFGSVQVLDLRRHLQLLVLPLSFCRLQLLLQLLAHLPRSSVGLLSAEEKRKPGTFPRSLLGEPWKQQRSKAAPGDGVSQLIDLAVALA